MADDYNKTLNLPKTDFPMKAGLTVKEPIALEKWEKEDLYERIIKKNEGKPLFVLHDGPPYANGDIHLGTALNKTLKDIIVRYKNMAGFKAPYVPGWDTHGLPIELKARKKAGIGKNANLTPIELRKVCKDFALSFVEGQKAQFKRLGVLGEWTNPYLTLRPEFEAHQIEVFGAMAEKGSIYKGLKPVYWCPECNTALAEAEIEYVDAPCYSIYVSFKVTDDLGKLSALGADLDNTYFVIWTTTTWTLPGNVAICVGPEYEYSVVKCEDKYYVIATELVDSTMKSTGREDYTTVGKIKGSELEYMKTAHPFLPRESLIIVGDHVTLESGTGCVHTAPGFGVEDFEVCNNYDELPIIVSVDDKGYLTDEAGEDLAGKTTDEANKLIAQKLEDSGNLFGLVKITHQYPHCWRCKNPIIFRATEQWFCSIDQFKENALEEIKKVNWIPAWGEGRISNMVRDRSDWCISRQRIWGVPIPIFYCEKCGKEHYNHGTFKFVADIFRKEGSDAWYTRTAKELMPEGEKCSECGGTEFRKETDIMDVWFDSGVTHQAVCEERDYLKYPADLYLEGADQYRGWFQSSLLTSVATFGKAPYKSVLTHGWVVDGEGRKMSKSLGNGIVPNDIINQNGADILRLWVASSDYQADVRISKDIIKQLSEVYRKIRNTARFILGNISDFDPEKDAVPYGELEEIDRWALSKLAELTKKVHDAYEIYEFHTISHAIHNFCVVDISNFYFDVLKNRLYIEKADSKTRRAAQTAIYKILDTLTLMIAPIIPFMAEEIWSYMPHDSSRDPESVMFNDMKVLEDPADDEFKAKWEKIHLIREDVKKAAENARAEKIIGSSSDAKITLYAEGELYDFLKAEEANLPKIMIVSQVGVEKGASGEFKGDYEGLTLTLTKAEGEKCERCWNYSTTVGCDSEHPTLCAHCAEIIKSL